MLQSDGARELVGRYPRPLVADAVRGAIAELRGRTWPGAASDGPDAAASATAAIVTSAGAWLARLTGAGLPRAVNATGVLLHTNLGRAPLGPAAREALARAAAEPSVLEIDIASGERGERDTAIEAPLRALTGAEAALVVNNNAAALVLVVDTLARRREVVVSRGELIEIGGSFRLPELLERSGVTLREVGTTNRTRVADYAEAITRRTGLVLKVHPSNYRVVGFTQEASRRELVELGRGRGVPVVEDLGSGALVDLRVFGVAHEPLVSESIRDGVDLVTFSGDKLLGGPQAGIVVGRGALVAAMQRNPLKRALRTGKLTLAALRATLATYLTARDTRELAAELPTFRFLARSFDDLEEIAYPAADLLRNVLPADFDVGVIESEGQVGSGAQPTTEIPSRAVIVIHRDWPVEKIAALFRAADPPIIGRIRDGNFLLDVLAVERAQDLVPRGAAGLAPPAGR